MTVTLEHLRSLSIDDLETLFAREGPVEVPRGLYRGHFLAWLDHPEARRKRWR